MGCRHVESDEADGIWAVSNGREPVEVHSPRRLIGLAELITARSFLRPTHPPQNAHNLRYVNQVGQRRHPVREVPRRCEDTSVCWLSWGDVPSRTRLRLRFNSVTNPEPSLEICVEGFVSE
jgi:hypothetical protein